MTNREKALKRINEYLAKQEPQKVELASAREIPKYENQLKEIQKKIRDFEQFKKQTKPEILNIVKWLNDLKSAVLKIGMNYKDVKGLKELNDLYWKVNSQAKENNII